MTTQVTTTWHVQVKLFYCSSRPPSDRQYPSNDDSMEESSRVAELIVEPLSIYKLLKSAVRNPQEQEKQED